MRSSWSSKRIGRKIEVLMIPHENLDTSSIRSLIGIAFMLLDS